MPKIIKNLDEKIFLEANKIFHKKGFEKTDMKAIAKASNIAVGTLYNYYPNKKSLYMEVFRKNWIITLAKLKEEIIEHKEKDTNVCIKNVVEFFYEDIIDLNALGSDIKVLRVKQDKEFNDVFLSLLEDMAKILSSLELNDRFKGIDRIYFKIVLLWISMNNSLIREFNKDKTQNINLIYETIRHYFK